ncbi:MAG: protein kinase domain-containing protein [Kofleriaceae bacterium]
MGCLEPNTAVDLVDGQLDEATTAAIEAHVATCDDCRRLIAAVARDGDAPETGPHDTGMTTTSIVLVRGAQVGRYVILEHVARGGMGEVYRAFDPELERTIAIKLVRPGQAGAEASARLIREARALAQLAHPNVVAIHDAGTFGDQVFIAMELVRGQTLRAWLRDARPPTARVLDALTAAGRGLLAAHEAGLIHRDFKPDNVVLGEDGRVRVLDFGLARYDRATHDDVHDVRDVRDDAAATSSDRQLPVARPDLTITGAVLGTPAYMAPEQHLGRQADARTDQFAFGVVLHEALFGVRPFPDDGLRTAVLAGRRVAPPTGTRGVGRIRHVIARALAVAPDERFPTMAALLDELARARASKSRRRTLLLVAAGGVLASTKLIAVTRPGSSSRVTPPCEGGGALIASAWSNPRRAEVIDAFARIDPRHGADTGERVGRALDGYASAWATMHQEACMTSRVRGEQSAELLDLRMGCLDRHRKQLAAVVELFATPDAALVGRAVQMTSGLPEIADCADVEWLRAPLPMPRDPRIQAEVATLTTELVHVTALRLAGRTSEGLALAKPLAVRARTIDHAPTRADAIFQLAFLHSTAGNLLEAEQVGEEAVFTATAARHPRLVARSALELAWVLGVDSDRRVEARRWVALARATIDAMGGSDELSATLEGALGAIALAENATDVAMPHLTRALELERRLAAGANNQDVARALANLAIVHHRRGEPDRSGVLLREAIAMFRSTLGEHHPALIEPTLNLAMLVGQQGNRAESEAFAFESWRLARDAGVDVGRQTEMLLAVAATHYTAGDLPATVAIAQKVIDAGASIALAAPARANATWLLALGLATSDPVRARGHALEARTQYLALGDAARGSVNEVETWLAAHRR